MDVALWQDFRTYHNMQPLTDAVDFIIVNFVLHEEFDKYKKSKIESGYSYLKVNELLEFYLFRNGDLSDCVVTQYNQNYLRLNGNDIDKFCRWVSDLRISYEQEGLKVFSIGECSKLDSAVHVE